MKSWPKTVILIEFLIKIVENFSGARSGSAPGTTDRPLTLYKKFPQAPGPWQPMLRTLG